MDGQFTTQKTVPQGSDASTSYSEAEGDVYKSPMKRTFWTEFDDSDPDFDSLQPYRAGAPQAEALPVNKIESWTYSRPNTLYKTKAPYESGEFQVYSLDAKKEAIPKQALTSYSHLDNGSLKVRSIESSYSRFAQPHYGTTDEKPVYRRNLGAIPDGQSISYGYGSFSTDDMNGAVSKISMSRAGSSSEIYKTATPIPYESLYKLRDQRVAQSNALSEGRGVLYKDAIDPGDKKTLSYGGFVGSSGNDLQRYMTTRQPMSLADGVQPEIFSTKRISEQDLKTPNKLAPEVFKSVGVDYGINNYRGSTIDFQQAEKKSTNLNSEPGTPSFAAKVNRLDGGLKTDRNEAEIASGRALVSRDLKEFVEKNPAPSFQRLYGKFDEDGQLAQSFTSGSGRIEIKDGQPSFNPGSGRFETKDGQAPRAQSFTSGSGRIEMGPNTAVNPMRIQRTFETPQPGTGPNAITTSPGARLKGEPAQPGLTKESGRVPGYNPLDVRPMPNQITKGRLDAISQANLAEIRRPKSDGFVPVPGKPYTGDGRVTDLVKKPETISRLSNGSNGGNDKVLINDQNGGKKNVIRENVPNVIDGAGGKGVITPPQEKGNNGKGTGTVAGETAVKVQGGQGPKANEQPPKTVDTVSKAKVENPVARYVKPETPETVGSKVVTGPKLVDTQPKVQEPKGADSGLKVADRAIKPVEPKVQDAGVKVVDRAPKVEPGAKVADAVQPKVDPRAVDHGPRLVDTKAPKPADSAHPDIDAGKRGTRVQDASAAQNPLFTGDRKIKDGIGAQNQVAVRTPAEFTQAGDLKQWLNNKNQISANGTMDANSQAFKTIKNWTESKGLCSTGRYLGGEVLLASFIIAAGIARRMPERQSEGRTQTGRDFEPAAPVRGQRHHVQPEQGDRITLTGRAQAQAHVRAESEIRVQATAGDRGERVPQSRVEDGSGRRTICDTTSKRFLSGIEIAALIAAGGIAKVRQTEKQPDAGDTRLQDRSPTTRQAADIAVARPQTARTSDRIPANNIQPAADSHTPPNHTGKPLEAREPAANPATRAARIHADRFIPGADIAIAALMVASGVAKFRNEKTNDTCRTEPGGRITLDRGLKGIFFTCASDRRPTSANAAIEPAVRKETADKKSILPSDARQSTQSVTPAKVEQGIADLLQQMAEQEFVLEGDSEEKAADKARISEIVSTAFGGIFGRQASETEGEAIEDEELEEDTESTGEEANAATTMYRPIWLISPGETFVGIAERHYGDPTLGWLIADLNPGKFNETWMDGKRIIEIQSRQKIELPVWQDIAEFNSNRPKEADADNLITIVTETTLDQELLASNFQTFLSPERKRLARPHFSPTPHLRPVAARTLRPVNGLNVSGMSRPQFATIAAAVSLPLILPPCEISQPHDLTRGPVQETIIDALPSAEPNS